MTGTNADTTVVLAHGASADGSRRNKVTEEVQRKGFNVVAAQIPLISFGDDVAVLKKVLLRQEGRVLLAGHPNGCCCRQSQREGAGLYCRNRSGRRRDRW